MILVASCCFVLMIRRPPRSNRTDTLFSLHDALPSCCVVHSPPWRRPGSSGGDQPATAAKSVVVPVGSSCSTHVSFEPPPCEELTIIEPRSEEHTSELQSLMRISYAVFCLKKKNKN